MGRTSAVLLILAIGCHGGPPAATMVPSRKASAQLPTCVRHDDNLKVVYASVTEALSGRQLEICLGHRDDWEHPPSVESCWRVDLDRGVYSPIPPMAVPRHPPETSTPFHVEPGASAVKVCDRKGRCTTVRPADYHGTDGDTSFAVSETGDLLVEMLTEEYVTFDVHSGRQIARFRVHSEGFGDQANGEMVGPSLLALSCAAGPDCEGRLVDPRSGRVIAQLEGNLYDGIELPVAGDVWAFADADGSGVEWVDVRTGRVPHPRLQLDGADPESGTLVLERRPGELLIVYPDADDTPSAGDVARVDLVSGKLVSRLHAPACEP